MAIDTRSLCQVIDFPHADMTVTVQAGITAAALHAVLAEHNQRLLIDIPLPDRATLGGVYATNTCGPRRFGLGRPRDQIIGVSFVTSAAIEVKGGGRVVKNVAGYDFPKLLTGSMGTLGILTQMTLKVRPRPEASAFLWLPFPGLAPLQGTLDGLNTSAARPVALDLLNAAAALKIGEPLNLPSGDVGSGHRAGRQRDLGELAARPTENRAGTGGSTVLSDSEAAAGWTALTDFMVAELGSGLMRRQPPPIVRRLISGGRRSRTVGRAGARGQRDRSFAFRGGMDARSGGRGCREVPLPDRR